MTKTEMSLIDYSKIVKDILSLKTGLLPEEITGSLAHDVGIDSLELIEVCMDLETLYHFTIEDDIIKKLKTVEDIVDYLNSRFKM